MLEVIDNRSATISTKNHIQHGPLASVHFYHGSVQSGHGTAREPPTDPVAYRDRHRERFDVPDHPLWDDLAIPTMAPRALGVCRLAEDMNLLLLRTGLGRRWSSTPVLQNTTTRLDGSMPPPRWSLEELVERYDPQSPVAQDDEDDKTLSPDSVRAAHGSPLSNFSDTTLMMEYDTPNTPPSPPWSS